MCVLQKIACTTYNYILCENHIDSQKINCCIIKRGSEIERSTSSPVWCLDVGHESQNWIRCTVQTEIQKTKLSNLFIGWRTREKKIYVICLHIRIDSLAFISNKLTYYLYQLHNIFCTYNNAKIILLQTNWLITHLNIDNK